MWALGIELRSSGLVTSTFTHRHPSGPIVASSYILVGPRVSLSHPLPIPSSAHSPYVASLSVPLHPPCLFRALLPLYGPLSMTCTYTRLRIDMKF